MSDQKLLDGIDFRVQRDNRRDLRTMRPALWVSLAVGLVSFLLAILQTYETTHLRSRLELTEMQLKTAEARATGLATKNQQLTEELTQANALIENLRRGPQAPLKSPARNGAASSRVAPR
jgi:hypothetical protein